MSEAQKKVKQLLSLYRLNRPEFPPESIPDLQDFLKQISQKLNELVCRGQKHSVQPVINKLTSLINSIAEEMSLHCVLKKIAILHCLIHQSKSKQLGETLAECVFAQVNAILNIDLQQIAAQLPQKRQSSLSKVQGFLRKLSGSKERSQSRGGKMALQGQKEKGALVEIINKIVRPFCFYLLKLLQNYETYWKVKTSKAESERAVLWKLVNWSKTLGNIIVETHRLARYFKADMLPLSVYFNYLISLDISVYYDVIRHHVQKEAQKWKKMIVRVEKNSEEEDPEMQMESIQLHYRELVKQKQLLQLKEFISQTRNIKQKLNYVFGNSMLVNYQSYFSRPSRFTFNSKNTKDEANIDYILQFFEKQGKAKAKLPTQSYYGKFQSISKYDTEQTLSKDSPQKQKQQRKPNSIKNQILNGPHLLDNIGESFLLSKIQKVKMLQPRLNKFLHPSADKQKYLSQMALFKCQQGNKIEYRQPNAGLNQ